MSEYGRTKLTLFLILILASAIVGTAGAALTVTVTSSPGTLVANGLDNATIRVLVMDGGNPVPNQPVDISVHNPLLGTLTPTSITTGPLGYAESQFSVATTSGTAIITAIVPNATPSAIAIPLTTPVADTIVLSTDKTWVIANGQDQATITATLTNTSYGVVIPVKSKSVGFFVSEGTQMGSVSPLFSTTDQYGNATVVYKSGTKSGQATIVAQTDGLQASITQQVDHDVPSTMTLQHVIEAYTGSETFVTAIIRDRWNNPVDNRRIAENVTFIVGSENASAKFFDETIWSDQVVLYVNESGIASARLKASEKPGFNNVQVIPPTPVETQSFTIFVISDGIPYQLLQTVDPSVEWNYADGEKKISITYILNDRFGNPIPSKGISFQVNDRGEPIPPFTEYTNLAGRLTVDILGRTETGPVSITATAVNNTSLVLLKTVYFVPTEPTDMLLTTSPMIMPSGEVPLQGGLYSISEVRAKVVDAKGNGVSNESVTFFLGNLVTIPASRNPPTLESSSVVTDQYGYARVLFHPGTFAVEGETDFTKKATANCTVYATWNGVNKTVDRSQKLEWKNYPILYAETTNEPLQVSVGNYTYVTINLKGDGFAIVPDPIDVILCTDRSGSMLYDNPDRMYSVREAGKGFVNAMSNTRDQVGVVTFGRKGYISRAGINSGISTSEIHNSYVVPRTYSDYATIDRSLTNNFDSIRQEMDSIVPDHGTPMRLALYRSINDVIANSRQYSVKAIILLSDGDYNWYGDPLARGTAYTSKTVTDYNDLTTSYHKFTDVPLAEQNLTRYAANHNIKIFSIGYATSISSGGKNTLRVLAEGTGGKYYDGNAANINQIYTDIAGELQTEAGTDIQLAMDFGTLTVDGVSQSNTNNEYLKYEAAPYSPKESTKITRYYAQNGTTLINVNDDTSRWESTHQLDFDVGKMYLADYWKVQFRLKVMKDGAIDIFGPGSGVDFNVNGQPYTLELPKITVYGSPSHESRPDCVTPLVTFLNVEPSLDANNLIPNGTKSLSLKWNLNYDGNSTVTEYIRYMKIKTDGFPPNFSAENAYVIAYSRKVDPSNIINPRFGTIDIANWEPGYDYNVTIFAESSCADGVNTRSPAIVPLKMNIKAPIAYMKLE